MSVLNGMKSPGSTECVQLQHGPVPKLAVYSPRFPGPGLTAPRLLTGGESCPWGGQVCHDWARTCIGLGKPPLLDGF